MTTPLRLAREARGLTIQQVAVDVGTDVGGLSRIERGIQTPSKSMIVKLVDFYGGAVTEVQILFPERFVPEAANDPSCEAA